MIYGPLHQKILLREIPLGKLINILYSFSSKIFPRAEKIVKEETLREIDQWKET
jgi:hypothetical protein